MRYITRTIKSSIVVTKCVDVETMEVTDQTFTITATPEEKIPRVINKMLDNSSLKLVKIIDVSTETNKYKMSEEDFIFNATVVD